MSVGGESLGVAVLDLATDQTMLDRGLAGARTKSDAALGRMQADANRHLSAVDRRIALTADKTGAVGTKMSRNLTLPLAAVGLAATHMAADFNQAMEQVHTQAGETQKNVNRLNREVLTFAKSGKAAQGPTDLANALYRLEGAGIRGERAMRALRAASDLAAVGNANVEDTAKTLAQAYFSGIKGLGSFKDVVSELNATVGAGDLRLQQLVDALGTGILPTARQAGLGFHDMTAALAVFGDETNNVSGWAAQLSTAFHFITNPTTKARNAFEDLGLKQNQLALDFRKPNGLSAALHDLRDHLDKLPGGARGPKATELLGNILPGGRGRVLLVLLNQLDRLDSKYKQIRDTNDRFGEAVQKTQEQNAFKIHAAWAKIEADAVDLGNAIGPTLVGVGSEIADEADKIATAFSKLPKGTQEAIVKGGLLVAGIGPALKLLSVFTKGVGSLYKVATISQRIGGGVAGSARASEAVATMEVGTLIAKAMVGGASGPGAYPFPGGGSSTRGGKVLTDVEEAAGAKGGVSLLSRAKMGSAVLLGRAANGLLILGIGEAAGHAIGGQGGHVLSSAAKGAAIGSLAGPEGALVGAGAGALVENLSTSPGARAAKQTEQTKGKAAAKAYTDAYNEYFTKHSGYTLTGSAKAQVVAAAKAAGEAAAKGVRAATNDPKFNRGMFKAALDAANHLRDGMSSSTRTLRLNVEHDMALIEGSLGKHTQAGKNAMGREIGAAIRNLERSMRDGRVSTEDGMAEIESLMRKHTGAGAQITAANFRAAAAAIKTQMDSGKISVQRGTKLINQYLVAAFNAIGIDAATAKLYIKDGITNPNKVPGTANPGAGVGHRPGNAAGALHQFGRPGDRGRDTIPATIGPNRVMVGSGEVAAVLNADQQAAFNARFADMGGLYGFFKQPWRLHHAAAGGVFYGHPMPHPGVAKAAQAIIKQFPGLGVTATTDGNHVPGSYHYKGEAVDLASGDYGLMDKAAAWIKSSGMAKQLTEGIHNPNLAVKFGQIFKGEGPFGDVWAGHRNHIHIALAGALAGKFGKRAQHIARVLVGGGGGSALTGLAQAGLDGQRLAAQAILDAAAASAGSSGMESDVGAPATGNGMALMKKIAAARGWNFADWWALDAAETSHGANETNPHSSARLRGQFLDMNYGKYGPGSDPAQNPTMEQQIEAMAEYIAARYGNPTAAWAFHRANNFYAAGGVPGATAASNHAGQHWVKGHWETTHSGKRVWVKGHYANNPHYGGSNPTDRGGSGLPAKAKKSKRPKFPKMPKVRPVQPFGLKGYDFPELAYRWLGDVMGESPRSLAALIEAESNQSTIFDRTDEEFIVTNPDGSTSIDQSAVNQRIGELTALIGMETPIQSLVGQAAGILPTLRAKAEKAREHYRNQVRKIKQRVRENLRKIKQLKAKVAAEKKKKHPSVKSIGQWQKQIVKLEGENLALTGSVNSVGDGGDLAKVQAHATAFNDALQNIGDWNTALIGISGTGGTKFDVDSTMFDLTSQLGQLSPDALKKALQDAGGAGGGGSALNDLKAQAYDQLVAAKGVEKVQNAIFSGMALSPIPGLPPFGGSFRDGGVVPGPVGAARTAIVHGGEVIGQPGAGGAHVTVSVMEGMLKNLIRVEVEQHTREQARKAARGLAGRGGGRSR